MRAKHSLEKVLEVLEQEDRNTSATAHRLGITVGALRNRLIRHGIRTRNCKEAAQALAIATDEELLACYRENDFVIAATARALGIAAQNAAKRLRILGVPIRKRGRPYAE